MSGAVKAGLSRAEHMGIVGVPMNPKYRNMRIDELQRLEKELREEYKKSKQRGVMQELRDVEQQIRDIIWNTGGAERKKEKVKAASNGGNA